MAAVQSSRVFSGNHATLWVDDEEVAALKAFQLKLTYNKADVLQCGTMFQDKPDLKDKDAYRAAGFKSAEEAVKKKLLPGEISVLANEIAKLSGYGVSVGEELNVAEEIEKN